MLDLTLIGKHLHWNVKGRHFGSLHLELDEQVAAWRELSDDMAERAVTIGASPGGQDETIAAATQLESLPTGHLADQQVLGGLGDRVARRAVLESAMTPAPSNPLGHSSAFGGPVSRGKGVPGTNLSGASSATACSSWRGIDGCSRVPSRWICVGYR